MYERDCAAVTTFQFDTASVLRHACEWTATLATAGEFQAVAAVTIVGVADDVR
jgi:hypothetical protein